MKLDICIASIGIPHDGLTLNERSLGGSETAAIMVARKLAERGHHVTVFSPLPDRNGQKGGIWDGVQWGPIEQFAGYANATPHDVTIISREVNLLRFPFNSKVKVFWCHDLALKRLRNYVGAGLWSLDAIYVLSEYQKKQYTQVYEGMPEDFLMVSRNGIDLRAFNGLNQISRDRNKLVYGSRPERGFEACLNIMDMLRRKGSSLRLEVSWYDDAGLGQQLAPYYDMLKARASQMPNVRLLGPLRQADWHRQIAGALAVIYPGPIGPAVGFKEISCIVAMEAQACGTPMVSVAKGAVPETLGAAGILLGQDDTDCAAEGYLESFADTLIRLQADPDYTRSLAKIGLERAQGFDWIGVAQQWERHWLSVLEKRCASPERLRKHLERMGDREALNGLG